MRNSEEKQAREATAEQGAAVAVSEDTFANWVYPNSKKKDRKWLWVLLGAIAVTVLVMVLALGLLTVGLRQSTHSAFKKTVYAVFPELETLDGFSNVGGEITLQAVPGSDMGEAYRAQTLLLQYLQNSSEKKLIGSLQKGEQTLDAALLLRPDGLQIGSDALLGDQVYATGYGALADALKASPLAPDGTLAMDAADFDLLLRALKQAQILGEAHHTALYSLQARVTELLEAHVTPTHARIPVQLQDGSFHARVYRFDFDASLLVALADLLADEWQTNAELRALVQELLFVACGEQEAERYLQSIDTFLTDGLRARSAQLACSQVSGNISWAVRGGYLVRLDAHLDMAQTQNEVQQTQAWDLSWVFSHKPSQNPNFDLHLTRSLDGVSQWDASFSARRQLQAGVKHESAEVLVTQSADQTELFRLTLRGVTQKDGDFLGEIDLKNELPLPTPMNLPHLSLTVRGNYRQGRKLIALDVETLILKSDGKTCLDLYNSTLTFSMEVKRVSIHPASDPVALPPLTEDRLRQLGVR